MSLPNYYVYNSYTRGLIESGAYKVVTTDQAYIIMPAPDFGPMVRWVALQSTASTTNTTSNTTSKTIWVDDIQQREQDLGFDPIPICRPQFIKFHFKGLKPNTRHYFFFDNRDMTNFTTTNATQISNYESASRNNEYRDPGEKYINAINWPLASGASGTILSTSSGELEGVFYLQRNSTTYFNVGELTMNVCDVSNNDFENCLSYASAIFSAGGTINYSYMQSYVVGQKEIANPNYVAPVSSGSNYTRGLGQDERDSYTPDSFNDDRGGLADGGQ